MKKVVEQIPVKKTKALKELIDLLSNNKTILLASISGIPGTQYEQIKKKMRNKSTIKVPKKNLILMAMDKVKLSNSEEMKKRIKEESAFAILFSNEDSFNLAGDLLKNKSPSKAKPGQIAPEDIEIPEGPTDLVPGPAISELGAVGIQIQIQGGKIHIKQSKVVAKKGASITQAAADILSKLNIMPFSIGFKPLCAIDKESGMFYSEIIIDKEGTLKELKESHLKALSFAVNLSYFCTETIKLMIQKAGRQEKRLIKVITGEEDEILEDSSEKTPLENKKEEPKVDSTAGLASLFG